MSAVILRPAFGADARRASFDLPPHPSDNARAVSDIVGTMERAPWRDPYVCTRRGIDRVVRVHVAVGDVAVCLDPDDARRAAGVLIADQAFAGCGEVAARLRDAADLAQRGRLRGARRPGRSGEPTMVAFLLIGGVVALIAGAGVLAGLAGL